MIIKMFAIYDEKALAHVTPFFMHNEMMAVREFRNLASDDKTQIGKNPTDFSLWHLGEFDDNTGEVIPERTLLIAGNQTNEISNEA